MNNLSDIYNAIINLSALAVFKNFIKDNIGVKFLVFLEAIRDDAEFASIVELYSDFVSELYNSESKGDWSNYVKNFVLYDENIVSTNCSRGEFNSIPVFILGAFEYELRLLSDIASISFNDIREVLTSHFPSKSDNINMLPTFDSYKLLFTKDSILSSYKTSGYGVVSRYHAFRFNSDLEIIPCKNSDKITFDDLKLYDYQKNILRKNTLALLNNKEANNILLYGDRGCGKSSSVKAVFNEFKNMGLKIVQVYKENLPYIESLIEFLKDFPSKFIIFIDDLVFDENDPMFSSCKALLEGSISEHPKNVVIYATTNRRHLIKETFTQRQGSELHLNDTLDETASLSDRFGITITFTSPDKNKYLEIVRLLASEYGINPDDEKLFMEAESFAIQKGNRAPRAIRQFLIDYSAKAAD